MGDKQFQFKIRAANLPARGFFGRGQTNPKYKLSAFQMGQAEPFYVVYESETIENNLSPSWKRSNVSESLFSDAELPVMISVFDKQANGQETPIGTVETSVNEMKRKAVGDTDEVDAKKIYKLKDAGGKEAGLIVVVLAQIVDADQIEAEPSEHPEPEPEPEPRASSAKTPDVPTTPQSTRSVNSSTSAASADRRSSQDIGGGGGGGSAVLEMARIQQALMDLNRKVEKLEKETSDLKKETSSLKNENEELKGRVKYLENSLKQDRKLMEMAQQDISDLKAGGGAPTLNGSKHAPNPSVLDGSLTNGDGVGGGMEDKSSKSKSSSSRDRDRSSPKKSSDHSSSGGLATIDSGDDRSTSPIKDRSEKTERSDRSTPRRHGSSPRRGSVDSKMSTKSSRSHTSSSSRSDRKSSSRDRDAKSPTRSMRRTRSSDGDELRSDRSDRRGGKRPGGGSSGKDKLRAAANKIKAAESLKK